MLSCREASRLISHAREHRPGLAERLKLGLHLALCAACRNFARQVEFLGLAGRHYAGSSDAGEEHAQTLRQSPP